MSTGEFRQKMSICRKRNCLPWGLNTEGGWRLLGKQDQRPRMLAIRNLRTKGSKSLGAERVLRGRARPSLSPRTGQPLGVLNIG